jgi:hypothetical protein
MFAGLLSRRPGFSFRPVLLGVVGTKWQWGRVLCEARVFPLQYHSTDIPQSYSGPFFYRLYCTIDDMIWYDVKYMIFYDLLYDVMWNIVWYDVIWYIIWYDVMWYDIWCAIYDIRCDMIYSVNCSWVATRWQQYSTHLHTNSTQNNTMKRNTQNRTYITVRIYKHNNKNT